MVFAAGSLNGIAGAGEASAVRTRKEKVEIAVMIRFICR